MRLKLQDFSIGSKFRFFEKTNGFFEKKIEFFQNRERWQICSRMLIKSYDSLKMSFLPFYEVFRQKAYNFQRWKKNRKYDEKGVFLEKKTFSLF